MIVIKKEYENTVIAFKGKSNIPLGKYSENDLIDLAILTHQSKNKNLLAYFENAIPSLEKLQESRISRLIN